MKVSHIISATLGFLLMSARAFVLMPSSEGLSNLEVESAEIVCVDDHRQRRLTFLMQMP